MTNQKIYEAIRSMKHIVSQTGLFMIDPDSNEVIDAIHFMCETPDESGLTIYDFTIGLQRIYKQLAFVNKVAFLTILSLGSFSDDEFYTTFYYMPSTAECMMRYKEIEKKLKRKQRITISFSLGNNHIPNNYNNICNYEIAVDLFSAKPICCKYYDTEGLQYIKRY